MKVSIIVPIYKVENEIERCLQSVLDQTYDKIELILVNDATPDKSFEIAKEYLANRSAFNKEIIFVEHEVNQGLSVARNSGIEASSGDYLFFLDSDDALENLSVVADMVSILLENQFPEVVMGNFNRYDGDTFIETLDLTERLYSNNADIYTAFVAGNLWMTAWGKLVSKKTIVDHQLLFKEGIYHEDELWSFLLFRTIESLYVTPKPVYSYYERVGSIMSNCREKNVRDFLTVTLDMYKAYQENPAYMPKQTFISLEYARRAVLQKSFYVNDPELIQFALTELKKIKIPLFGTGKTSFFKQNLLLRFPTIFIVNYLRVKYR
ncbi:MAG TPA: glycosyltransferase family 2 protein [Candidatus Ignatzschineria merdigallinarum]|uniref:Glycosyltransferase family 2 protein n=1 Tax=Candidatus Ignatzschineria merdigallinarum TaxID=2838621 RepID=A0A9D1Q7P2_9GAMM|nr:glycosyltransferase family 2 protein [Candidatus Ignatzschineria merdigallinarum]